MIKYMFYYTIEVSQLEISTLEIEGCKPLILKPHKKVIQQYSTHLEGAKNIEQARSRANRFLKFERERERKINGLYIQDIDTSEIYTEKNLESLFGSSFT